MTSLISPAASLSSAPVSRFVGYVPVFAALGDSTTAGYGDRVNGAWRGWAPIFAEAFGARLHNFAVSGGRAADLESDQLPRALAVKPDLAAVLIGTNDTLRDPFDADRFAGHLERTVAALRSAGAEVLTIRLPDPGRMLGLPGSLARPLARRMVELNRAVDLVAARHDTVHFDAAGNPAVLRPPHVERRPAAPQRAGPPLPRLLVLRPPARPRPGPGARGRPRSRTPSRPRWRRRCLWLSTAGVAWMIRRSTDLLPGLARMAWDEWRHGAADLELLAR